MHKYIIENENDIFSRIENTHAYKSSEEPVKKSLVNSKNDCEKSSK